MQWKALAVAINITEFIVWGYQRRADDAAAVGSCGFQTCCREKASYHNYQDNVCSGWWNNFFWKTNEKEF